jgi:hypothetical protein
MWFNEREYNIYLFVPFFTKSRSTSRSSWLKTRRAIIKLQCLPESSYSFAILKSLGSNIFYYNGSPRNWLSLWNDISLLYICTWWIQPFTESCRNLWYPYFSIIRKIHCSWLDNDWVSFFDKSCWNLLPLVLWLLHKQYSFFASCNTLALYLCLSIQVLIALNCYRALYEKTNPIYYQIFSLKQNPYYFTWFQLFNCIVLTGINMLI